ncbi:MAG: CYTH domain-containing protein [Erysipelotrichaceae bacterium]
MEKQQEIEYKVLLDKENFYRLANLHTPLEFKLQINHYFKNNNSESYAFRIREINGEKLFTLKEKEAGKVFEYEKILDTDINDDTQIRELLAEKGIYPPYQELGILKTYRAISFDGYGELCFDINLYNGLIDYEIEYEVKKDHDHYQKFKDILGQIGLEYTNNSKSKYKRFKDSTKGE